MIKMHFFDIIKAVIIIAIACGVVLTLGAMGVSSLLVPDCPEGYEKENINSIDSKKIFNLRDDVVKCKKSNLTKMEGCDRCVEVRK